MRWLYLDWYRYLFRKSKCKSLLRSLICRIKNHPEGMIFYDIAGTEPDTRCKNCLDNIG